MPAWLINLNNSLMPYYGFIMLLIGIPAAIVAILTIFSVCKKHHFPGKFFKICFNFFKRIWINFKVIASKTDNISLMNDELVNLTQKVSDIEKVLDQLTNSASNYRAPDDMFFISHGFLWQYIDKTKARVLSTPLCLYCYEKEKLFFHMKDITQNYERQGVRDFKCPNCKDDSRIYMADYQNILQEELF